MMVWNHARVILILVLVVVSRTQGQSNGRVPPPTKFAYPPPGYNPPYMHPCQYPYGYGQFGYPPQPAPAVPAAPAVPMQYVRPQTGVAPWQTQQQQYYLGPMNAAQASYLIAYIKSLIRYGDNTVVAPQIPSTPLQNTSSIVPTSDVPPPTPTPSASSESSPTSISLPLPTPTTYNETDELPSSTDVSLELSSPEEQPSTPPPLPPPSAAPLSVIMANHTDEIRTSIDLTNTTRTTPVLEPRAAQVQPNPFVSSPSYRLGNCISSYNPGVASVYSCDQLHQPYYPPGFGPLNPFVLAPVVRPTSQPNTTTPPETLQYPQGGLANTRISEPSSAEESTAGGGGLTAMEDLPPQVKAFINMIPDILSMPETSQLSPANNNAIIHRVSGGLNGAQMGVHQLGGGPEVVTPSPRTYDLKKLRRFKKRRPKPRYRGF